MTTPTTSPEPSAWWPTTWGVLLAGDEVQAPDGSAWMVIASIVSEESGEWLITRDDCKVWTPHPMTEMVTARRYPFSGSDAIMKTLERILPDMGTVLPNGNRPPGGGRWVLCGREVCTCRW